MVKLFLGLADRIEPGGIYEAMDISIDHRLSIGVFPKLRAHGGRLHDRTNSDDE